jgi:hypothetical protein
MRYFIPALFLGLLTSCSNKYKVFENEYHFRSSSGVPDYSYLNYWAAHPWKKDPSDSVPAPLQNEQRDSVADVFFFHPTTYTSKRKMKGLNADIDNPYFNAKTDYSTILYQASAFNKDCRVFAPRYRQAHISNFYLKDKEKAAASFDMAYEDLKTAFQYYMQHWNSGRPIIIASHSQGSLLAERLLKEFFDEPAIQSTSLKNKLVVAYILGWPVSKDYFTTIPVCADSLQTGCICTWRTLRKGFVPYYLRSEKGNSYVTNPLNWTAGADYATRQLNKGSVLTSFNHIYKNTTDAQVNNGLLYVHKPKFPGSFFYWTKNYHIGDINLYYLNIRENVSLRLKMYKKKST